VEFQANIFKIRGLGKVKHHSSKWLFWIPKNSTHFVACNNMDSSIKYWK